MGKAGNDMALSLINFQSGEKEKKKQKSYSMSWYFLQNRYKILWKHSGGKVMESVRKSCHLPEANFHTSLEGWVRLYHREKRERDDGEEKEVYRVWAEKQMWIGHGGLINPGY